MELPPDMLQVVLTHFVNLYTALQICEPYSDDIRLLARRSLRQYNLLRRFHRPLSSCEMDELRALVVPMADVLPMGLDPDDADGHIVLHMIINRTTAKLLCDDFPEIDDTIAYSNQIIQIDDLIESWDGDPPFTDTLEVDMVQGEIVDSHPWNGIARNVTHIKGVPFDEARRREREARELASLI